MLRNFFDEERLQRWPKYAKHLHFHCLFERDLTDQLLVEPFREITQGIDGVVPVHAEWLHLTVQHIGPANQVSDDELARLRDRIRNTCRYVRPFVVEVQPPTVDGNAIVCPVRQRDGMPEELWKIGVDATAEIFGSRFEVRPSLHHPHISLAYCDSDTHPQRSAATKRWLSRSTWTPVTLPVTALHLVSQHHDGHEITWEPIEEFPLGEAAA